MKKIIVILLLMTIAVWGSDIYLDNENNFVWLRHTANLDSARIRFFLENPANQVDSILLLPDLTIIDSATVLADSFSLDATGNYLAQIMYYPHGGTPDTFIADVISSYGSTKIDSLHDEIGRRGAYPSLHAKLGAWGDSVAHSMSFALSEYIYDINALLVDIEDDSSGGGSGTGPFTVKTYVKDDDDDYLNARDVRLESSGGGSNYWAETNTSGYATFNVDSGTYIVYVEETPRYTQDVSPDTFTFTTDYTDTVLMTDNDAHLCGLYGYVYDMNNQPLKNASVNISIPDNYWPVSYGGVSVRARASVKTDANGKFDFGAAPVDGIYPNSLLLTQQGDSSSVCVIMANYRNELLFSYTIVVPDTDSVDLADVEKQ